MAVEADPADTKTGQSGTLLHHHGLQVIGLAATFPDVVKEAPHLGLAPSIAPLVGRHPEPPLDGPYETWLQVCFVRSRTHRSFIHW